MKTIETKSSQLIHLYEILGVTEEQFKIAQDWYLGAQQDNNDKNQKEKQCVQQLLKH